MLVCLSIFIVYQFAILPLAYFKMVGHKLALVIKNPTGVGGKTTSDRFGYAFFFLCFGLIILFLDCLADIYWFVVHVYQTNLDVAVQKQKESDHGFGIHNAIDRRTFKKMLHYFEVQSSAEM